MSDISPDAAGEARTHLITLFGATGDLARRKLLPALLHLHQAQLLPRCAVVGTSLDDLDDDGFREFAGVACDDFARLKATGAQWNEFASRLLYMPIAAGAEALGKRVE